MPEGLTWGWYPEGNKWVKLRVDADGSFHVVGYIDELNDIGDVNVPALADKDIIVWDAATSKWIVLSIGDLAAHAARHENGGDDEVSVAGLSGLLADDQHVLDAEAKAAAVQAGAITDGVTKAPTHDAVYDVAVIAATATTPGEVDTKITTHTDDVDAHHSNVLTLTFIIDGGGVAITTGEKGHLEIPFACTITRVTALADQSGSIVVDIWKDTYANFPPTNADSITAAAPPTITTAQKSQDSTLTGWTTAIAAGDILAFNVDSITTITRVTISLKVEKG